MTAGLDGAVALATGAAGGIGRAAAVAFAQAGATVVAVDVDAAGAHETVDLVVEAGGTAQAVVADLTDEAAVADLVAGVVDEHGRLDCAFNNAGITGAMGTFHELDRADFERMIEVNLTSVFLCMKHELGHFVARGDGGAIVNTSSGAGMVAAPGMPHYTAAKHGVLGLTRAAATEYARAGIRVNAVLPGSTDTPMTRAFIGGDEGLERMLARGNATGRLLDPAEVADVAVWLCSEGARRVNGQSVVVDGGAIHAR